MHIRRHEPRSTSRVLRAAAAASLLALALLAGLSAGDARAAGPGVERYYPGEGLVLTDPGAYTLKLSGYIQPAVETYDFLGGGPDGANTRFRLRRGRLSLAGSAPRQRVSFRFQLELTGRSETGDESGGLLLDAFVNWRITDTLQLSFGQRSTYTDNRELFMELGSLQLVERSRLTSLFASIREFGLFLQDRIRLGTSQHYLRPYLVLTNGDGPNVFSGDHGGLKLGGRLDWLPLGLFYSQGQFRGADVARELVPRLVIGVAYSYNWGMSSRRGRESGSILYLNDDDEESLPDYGKLCVDFLFKYQGFTALGELVYTHATVPDDITQRVRTDGTTATSFEGGVDAYVRSRMMLGMGFNLQAGYLFPFGTSIDARFTHFEADTDSFLTNGTFYNRPNYYTLGVSQYLFPNYSAKIQASVTYVDTDPGSNDFSGTPKDGDELIVRVQSTLSF